MGCDNIKNFDRSCPKIPLSIFCLFLVLFTTRLLSTDNEAKLVPIKLTKENANIACRRSKFFRQFSLSLTFHILNIFTKLEILFMNDIFTSNLLQYLYKFCHPCMNSIKILMLQYS